MGKFNYIPCLGFKAQISHCGFYGHTYKQKMGKKIVGLKGIKQLQCPNQTFSLSIIKVTSLQLKAFDKRLTHPHT